MVKLTKIRGDIDNAHDDVKEATKALREIENEIVAEQTTDLITARQKHRLTRHSEPCI